MGNCNACTCNDKGEIQAYEVTAESVAQQQDTSFRHSKPKDPKNEAAPTVQFSFQEDMFRSHIKQIIRLQSLWRGHSARKLVSFIKNSRKTESKYFTIDESKETVSSRQYNPDAKRENRGTYTFKSGATYTGSWVGGFRDGFGVQVWPDGARYEGNTSLQTNVIIGNWKHNRAHGFGKFIHIDGDIYEGNWMNDKANGNGIYIHTNGAKYDGQWKDDLQNGKGKETWNDGSKYDGDYIAGKKHGYGQYSWSDGSKFEGQWYDNKINGLGTYSWADGRKYLGQWEENNMHGIGVYYWPDGRRYEGQYKDDKKHGFGIYVWSDGREYHGYWFKGKQHGLGKYQVPNNQMKYGLWEEGRRIQWFDEQEAKRIVDGEIDYTTHFQKPQSAANTEGINTFDRPYGFDNALESIHLRVAECQKKKQ